MNDPRILQPKIAKMALELITRVPLQGGEVDAFCHVRAALRVVAEAPELSVDGEDTPELQRRPDA